MGTRNLTIIRIDNEIKVAQYGQWDGYPTGQCKTIVEFINHFKYDLTHRHQDSIFKEKVRNLRWLTNEEANAINKKFTTDGWMSSEQDKRLLSIYPYLHRDTGAKILWCIMYGQIKGLSNQIEFLNDSLSCEWAYELNLDTGELIVYREGNNKYAVFDIEKVKMKDMEELEEKSNQAMGLSNSAFELK